MACFQIGKSFNDYAQVLRRHRGVDSILLPVAQWVQQLFNEWILHISGSCSCFDDWNYADASNRWSMMWTPAVVVMCLLKALPSKNAVHPLVVDREEKVLHPAITQFLTANGRTQ